MHSISVSRTCAKTRTGRLVHSLSIRRPYTVITSLKGAGLAIALLGLGITLLDALGKFRSREKQEFARLLREGKGGLPRSTPGFTQFLSAFPPPEGIDQATVSHTTKDIIQTHDGFPVSITVRYVANNQRTAPVASHSDITAWAEKTRQKWWSFFVGVVGWLMVASAFLLEALALAN
jgi:hypothetical protein